MQSTNDMQSTDYRLLSVGEVIREGDEHFRVIQERWAGVEPVWFGTAVLETYNPIRRRTTLRDELETLADNFRERGLGIASIDLRLLIAKHWPTQEPTK